MFRIYFGQIFNGRILRLPFFGYWMLLGVIVIGVGIGSIFAIGMAESFSDGDLQRAQADLQERLGLLAMLLLLVAGAALFFANINLMAKRARDTGLPGWWTVILYMVAAGLLSVAVSDQAAGILHAAYLLALFFLPSDTFGGRVSPS